MPKVFTSKTQKIGEIGESVVARYLVSKGYKILERNYTKQCGEIDIVSEKQKIIHFVEVKSKTVKNVMQIQKNDYRPEDNMHSWKQERMKKTIQNYLIENEVAKDWQVDLIVVYLEENFKNAKVEIVENIIL